MKESLRLSTLLRELFAAQKFAALATDDRGKPHNCLVAFAATDDLRNLLFTTSRNTSKYRNILAESQVAMLVDSRSNQDSDLRNAVAVTAKGIAKEARGKERDRFLRIYLAKQSNLSDFAESPDTALVKIAIEDYEISTFRSTKTFSPR